MKNKFPKMFSKLLKERNIKQYQVAKTIGSSQGSISKYASGNKTPSIKKLLKIADYFDVSLDYLLTGKTPCL